MVSKAMQNNLRKRRKNMKQFQKIFGVSLVVLIAVMMVSAVSFAGSGSPQIDPNAPPPYGISMHGDAKGVKLYGSISIKYEGTSYCNIEIDGVVQSVPCAPTSTVVLQLQTAKGDVIRTFVKDVPDLPYDPGLQVDALIAAFKTDILANFFKDDKTLTQVVLVALGEYQPTPPDEDPNYMIASITLAVN
jgi:hypothetical protein